MIPLTGKGRSAVEDEHVDLGAQLKKDDLLYHEFFVVLKEVLKTATSHTVEEMQSFSFTRTPSPPWIHLVRTLVPLSCCDEAATYLIKALGGEDIARQVVGGVKWWQVRGVNGVDAQWITMKKHWQEAKIRQKQGRMGADSRTSSPPEDSESDSNGIYDEDTGAMRCTLYLHGGGYYFGSIDQTRYSSQRFARKINGRVFAIDYRLAPQYPFPCGLHDALAAYLFLIRPPPGSGHVAINPAHIIISGDSAGGGLSLALLQVIRDSGLPLPAGGVLISPWCDLTHSFPSLYQNTKKDFIPKTGLSFHKPSILWPPPSPDTPKRVHAPLRHCPKQSSFRLDGSTPVSQTSTIISERTRNVPHHSAPFDLSPRGREKVVVRMSTGEDVEIKEQLQFYTVNSLLNHPLVSPITGYLGGLPPLLFIAGDEEVLRDEIIYTAHKAAYPEKYPVLPSSRLLYPRMQDIEMRPKKPTSVHLQVYDGTHHILPIIFLFTSPAKFCFRAIANFDRFVTDMKMSTPTTSSSSASSGRRPSFLPSKSLFASYKSGQSDDAPRMASGNNIPMLPISPNYQSSSGPALSGKTTQALLPTLSPRESREARFRAHCRQAPNGPSDACGLGFRAHPQTERAERTAGEPQVYEDIKDPFNWECRMIRERVSTSGIVRHLEPEGELAACRMPHDRVAQLSEETIRQYLINKQKFDQRFGHTKEAIEKKRQHNLAEAEKDTIKRITTVLHQSIGQKRTEARGEEGREDVRVERLERKAGQSGLKSDQRVLLSSPRWAWSWVLDEWENPPPSSLVARRDTEEARELAAVVDWATRDAPSGNNRCRAP